MTMRRNKNLAVEANAKLKKREDNSPRKIIQVGYTTQPSLVLFYFDQLAR
jgi:hypothetical protein